MFIRLLAGCAVISLAIGLVVASISQISTLVPSLMAGAWITIQLTVIASAVAVFMAIVSALAKMYSPLPIRWLAIVYIEIFRGTSAVVQLFWFFFVLPHFGLTFEPMTAAILALGLCVGAYGSEVVRGAIEGVHKGQWEAATALNMGPVQTMRRIVLPQAFTAMIPPWGNLFIELLKATSLVSLITIGDLSFKAQQLNQTTLRTVEIFTTVLFIYLVLSIIITLFMRLLERRFSIVSQRGRAK